MSLAKEDSKEMVQKISNQASDEAKEAIRKEMLMKIRTPMTTRTLDQEATKQMALLVRAMITTVMEIVIIKKDVEIILTMEGLGRTL